MIPEFPDFKNIELSDKLEVERLTQKFPPYSDFCFPSLYSWNTSGYMAISRLHNNLVVRFNDYLTSEPFFSFLGVDNVNDVVSKLLKLAHSLGFEPRLKLIPKHSVDLLDSGTFHIEEDRDHFDYVYLVDNLIHYPGSVFKTHRNSVNSFDRKYKSEKIRMLQLDMSNSFERNHVLKLHDKWKSNKGFIVQQESIALKRYLSAAKNLECICLGMMANNNLIGFNVYSLGEQHYANCLFSNGDVSYYGIYSVLMTSSATIIKSKGVKFINFEQDLGIFNLKKAKISFKPHHFLKKYKVSLK